MPMIVKGRPPIESRTKRVFAVSMIRQRSTVPAGISGGPVLVCR